MQKLIRPTPILLVLCVAWVISLITLQSVMSLLADAERLLLLRKSDPTPNIQNMENQQSDVHMLRMQESVNKWISYYILPGSILAVCVWLMKQKVGEQKALRKTF